MRFAKVSFFSAKDLSTVIAFIRFPYWQRIEIQGNLPAEPVGGSVPMSQIEASIFPCPALTVRKGFSDSCPHYHRQATWVGAALTVRQRPAAALTGCADVCIRLPRESTSEISRKIRESFANVPLKSRFPAWGPPTFPKLHHPVLVAGTRIGLSCATDAASDPE